MAGQIRGESLSRSRPALVHARALALFARGFQTWNEHGAIIRLDRTGLRLVEGGGDFLNMRSDHGPVDRGHNQHGERAAFKALLGLHVLVASKETR